MEEIRTLRQDELEESLRLSEFAFQTELTPDARAERLSILNPEEIWGYFTDDKLAAKLALLPRGSVDGLEALIPQRETYLLDFF